MTPVHRSFRRNVALPVAITAMLCMLALYAASLTGNLVPQSRYIHVIAEAVEGGVLERRASLPSGDDTLSVFNFNDCLIFSMLVLPQDNRPLHGAISPSVPAVAAPWDGTAAAGYPRYAQCRDLAAAMAESVPFTPYHRYLHGGWVVAKAMLAVMPLWAAGNVLGLLVVGSLLLLIAATLRSAVQSPANRSRDTAYAFLAAALLLFHAFPIFGRSFSFAPADIVLHSALLFFYLKPPASLDDRSLAVAAAALFGSLTAIFELLTGDIPSGAIALMAVMALDRWPETRTMLVRTSLALGSFFAAIALCFITKLAVVATLWGSSEIAAMADALDNHLVATGWHIAPENAARLQAWGIPFDAEAIWNSRWLGTLYGLGKMAYFARLLTFGSVALAAFLIFAVPLILAARHGLIALRVDGVERWRMLLVLMACAVIPVWCFVMVSHTIVHAHFMFRLLVWPLAALTAAEGWRYAAKDVSYARACPAVEV